MSKWTFLNEWSIGASVVKVMQHKNGVIARTYYDTGIVRYWPRGSSINAHPADADGRGYSTLQLASRKAGRDILKT